MAPGYYSAVPPPPNLDPNAQTTTTLPLRPAPRAANTTPIDIEAWTVSALASLQVSPVARGTGHPLTISLDDDPRRIAREARHEAAAAGRVLPRKLPPVRDNLRRREELRKGKEGSRQRRRWENDRLLGVPNAQPPQPVDYLPRATHPVTHVPYHVAQHWDAGLRQRIEEKSAGLAAARKRQQRAAGSATGLGVGEVSREVREGVKRTPVLGTWVKELEEPVRRFVSGAREDEDGDEEMEEVVFSGRREREGGWKKARREVRGEVEAGLVFEPVGGDEAAAVKRWLAHAISDYYGLESKSVTVGKNPGRRVVYLGFKAKGSPPHLPRPMWEVC